MDITNHSSQNNKRNKRQKKNTILKGKISYNLLAYLFNKRIPLLL